MHSARNVKQLKRETYLFQNWVETGRKNLKGWLERGFKEVKKLKMVRKGSKRVRNYCLNGQKALVIANGARRRR